jgi:hypothetical protein
VVAGPAGLGPEIDCAGEARQRLWEADPSSGPRGAPRISGPAIVSQWWKSGRGSQMGALFRGGLTD